MFKYFLLLSLLVFVYGINLKDLSLIMSHDSATGYLTENTIVNDWTKTQTTNLTGQLNCGARSFDLRPYCVNKTVYLHHGLVTIKILFSEAVDEVINWHQENNEIVALYISHPNKNKCLDEAVEILENKNITVLEDCYDVDKYDLKNEIVGVTGCVDENYEKDVQCYEREEVCYIPLEESGPMNRFFKYMRNVTQKKSNMVSINQMHWQYNADSILMGMYYNSSIIQDEKRSKLNQLGLKNLQYWKYINMLELNNVCHYGKEIYQALNSIKSK